MPEDYNTPITEAVTKYQSISGTYPIGFIIWYGDGTSYRSRTLTKQEWQKLPKEDVQIIMVFENTKDGQGRPTRVYMGGCDYYTFDGEFKMTNDTRLLAKNDIILYGRWLTDAEFQKLQKTALADYDI